MIDTAEVFEEITEMSRELADIRAELAHDAGGEPYVSIPICDEVTLEIETAPHADASALLDDHRAHVRGVVRNWHSEDGSLLTERVVFVAPLEYSTAIARTVTASLLQEAAEWALWLDQVMEARQDA